MPHKTFFNLSKEKQNKIIKFAKEEFANYLFEDASVNRIVKAADLSRGSFYLYFENKEDLYFYVLDLFFEERETKYEEIAKKNNKDIKKTLLDIYDYNLENNKELMKNIFINFNTRHAFKFIPLDKEPPNRKKLFDFSNYEVKDEKLVAHMLDTLLIQSISFAIFKIEMKEIIKDKFINEIDIILKGIERRQK